MKTIHPTDLDARIAAHEAVEILDLRSRSQFQKRHVPGAHSLPFEEFQSSSILCDRNQPLPAQLYVISQKGGLAHIAADDMEDFGRPAPIVVEGGMENWDRHRLPVDRHDFWTRLLALRNRPFFRRAPLAVPLSSAPSIT